MHKTIIARSTSLFFGFLLVSMVLFALSVPTFSKGNDYTLEIISVKCITPSGGTDGKSTALFAALGGLGAIGPRLLMGKAFSLSMLKDAANGAKKGVDIGNKLAEQYSGSDALYITLNGKKVWPKEKDYFSIDSQESQNVDFSFSYNRGTKVIIQLMESDWGLDDLLGRVDDYPLHGEEDGKEVEFVLANKGEKSLYLLTIKKSLN